MFTHEIIRYDEKLPVKLFLQQIGRVDMHWHESTEILMVLTGNVTVEVESSRYELKPEDIILINHHQMHATTGDNSTLIALQIPSTLFKEMVPKGISFQCCSAGAVQQAKFDPIRSIISQLILYCSDSGADTNPHTNLHVQSQLYLLMSELMKSFRSSEANVTRHSSETLNRLNSITGYISDHYRENITLNDIAQQQFLTVPYLSSFFVKNMGMTFTKYLNSLRLHSAYADLVQTDRPIDDIAISNGFANPRAFATTFKKEYGMLPSHYRTEYAQNKKSANLTPVVQNYLKIEKTDYLSVLKKYSKPTNAPTHEPLSRRKTAVTADASISGTPLKHTYRRFTSVGRAKELLFQPVQAALIDLQREIPFEYIKFHGILDDSMMVYRENEFGEPIYNFIYVDMVLDFLQSIHLHPLIQFSFMPSALAKSTQHTEFASPVIISEPKDDGRWCDLIRAFTQHILSQYGQETVRKWIFTFWNEPFGNTPFAFPKAETATHLYHITYAAVKQCDPHLTFASPSILPTLSDSLHRNFMEYCRENQCMPDCMLIHSYQVVPGKEGFFGGDPENPILTIGSRIALSEDPNEFQRQIGCVKDFFRDYPPMPIYLTEWNFSTSHREWLNDTCYRSVFLARNILENYDQLDSFGIWTLTDLNEELPPSHALFHGGMGLYTRNGIPKPARLVLGMLQHLRDRCICRSEGYFVTKDDRGYTAVLYHYQHYSSLYAKGILFDGSPNTRYDVFPDVGSLTMRLSLENIDDGTYSVTEYTLNRQHGSAYDTWRRMGGEEPQTEEDINYLRRSSMPQMRKTKLTVSGNTLHYEDDLEPLEVRVIIFTKDVR